MVRVSMGKATKVLEPLQYVIDKLSVKRPLYTYEGYMYRDIENHEGKIEVTVTRVKVMQDAEVVGAIEYRFGEGRSTGTHKPDAILVQSTHIHKQRGHQSGVMTNDADKAVKLALKHFGAPEIGKVCDGLKSEGMDRLDNALYKATIVLEDIVSFSQRDMRLYWVERELFGKDIPIPQSVVLHKDKLHLYDKYLAGKQIGEAISDKQNQKGYLVHELSDRSIRVLPIRYKLSHNYEVNKQNGIELVRYRNFEDIPTELQGKIAMLRLAEEFEPYKDVGVKLSQDNTLMYIME